MFRSIRFQLPTLLLSLLLAAPATLAAEEYAGVVNHVLDPSTVRIGYKGGQVRVQLPDPAPAAGPDREALRHLLFGKEIVVADGRWENGRLVGRLCVTDADAARGLEQLGYGPIPSHCRQNTLGSASPDPARTGETGA